jgi:hypothetical protein
MLYMSISNAWKSRTALRPASAPILPCKRKGREGAYAEYENKGKTGRVNPCDNSITAWQTAANGVIPLSAEP